MCMLIGLRQRIGCKTLCLLLNDSVLKQVSSTKYLEAYIDQNLTWQNHVDYVLIRVRGNIYRMAQILMVENFDKSGLAKV